MLSGSTRGRDHERRHFARAEVWGSWKYVRTFARALRALQYRRFRSGMRNEPQGNRALESRPPNSGRLFGRAARLTLPAAPYTAFVVRDDRRRFVAVHDYFVNR